MKRIIILSTIGTGLLLASFKAGAPKVSKYVVNPAQSKIEWNGRKMTGSHTGTVNIQEGYLLAQKGKIVSGRFEIDMTSIKNTDITDPSGNMRLTGHLKSADFFDVGHYQTALLAIKRILPYQGEGQATHNITGDLTIKGITNEITFPATMHLGKNGITGTAEFDIDRTKWDIRYGSKTFFESIGDKAIFDDIHFKVSITASEWKK
jgi:polyisoprenoid-binding protein YceI